MQSFRSELENLNNPIVEKDIIDLANKIDLFHNNQVDEEKFRSLRLARGVYGQRQPGVQMVRIKIPYGKLTFRKIRKIADLSDEFATSNLHATTRQDIQIHYVSLSKTPELWAKLEQDGITIREACGNTVRNVTASAIAGIDPNEPFDITPYAHATFEYFLRNPVCQEMGRKFKIAFSSSENDSAFAWIHDVGVIPVLKNKERGFKILIAGGLGSNPYVAKVAYEFLPENQLIPFIEATLRVFDRHGERTRRMKARFKFLVAEIGVEATMDLIKSEWKSLKNKTYKIDTSFSKTNSPNKTVLEKSKPIDLHKYQQWYESNVFEQKQKGYYGIFVKLLLGNMSSDLARKFVSVAEKYAIDDIRITVNQGYLLKFVLPDALHGLFNELNTLGLAEPGFDSTADITACPGTDTCNLGVSSSTGAAEVMEDVINKEYPDLIKNQDIKIKISGCPNACGQHSIASIGFQGSSQKDKATGKVFPALQVLLGGSVNPKTGGRIADKVIKVPSKRGPEVLRFVLSDYEQNAHNGEYFSDYYIRRSKMYFYELLKPIASLKHLKDDDFIDWFRDKQFFVAIGTGECAGVIIDLVQSLIFDTEEKYNWAKEAMEAGQYMDAIYHAYNTFLNGAKALLLDEDIITNSHYALMKEFDKVFVNMGIINQFEGSFMDSVLRINKNEPTAEFAKIYIDDAKKFLDFIKSTRKKAEMIEA